MIVPEKEISQEFSKDVTLSDGLSTVWNWLLTASVQATLNISSYNAEKNAWENSVATVDEASDKIHFADDTLLKLGANSSGFIWRCFYITRYCTYRVYGFVQ